MLRQVRFGGRMRRPVNVFSRWCDSPVSVLHAPTPSTGGSRWFPGGQCTDSCRGGIFVLDTMTTAMTAITPEALLAHHQWVRSLARSLVRDPNAADDLVQETWLAALRSPPRNASSIRAWLGRVLRNTARQNARGESRRRARERAVALPEGLSPAAAEVVARADAQQIVVQTVLALDEPGRSAILLRFFDELPPREIAKHLDVPVETVRARIRRALDRMRADLDREHGGRREWALVLAPVLGPIPTQRAGSTDARTAVRALLPAAAAATVVATVWFVADHFVASARRDRLSHERERATALVAATRSDVAHIDALVERERLQRRRMDAETARLQNAVDAINVRLERRATADVSGTESAGDAPAGSGAPRFPFVEYADALDAVDWTAAGRHIHALIRLMSEFVPYVAQDETAPPDLVGRKQRLTGPVLGLVFELRNGSFPECHGNGQLAHPAVACQTIAAVLDAAGLPLNAEQSTALEAVARNYDAEDRRVRRERTGDEPALLVGAAEADARRRFLVDATAVLTEEQHDTLRPPNSRGLLGPDMFSATLVWQGRRTTHVVIESRDAYGAQLWSRLTRETDFRDAAAREAVRAVFDTWLARLPDDELTVPLTPLAANGWYRDERVASWTDRTVALYRGLERVADAGPVLDRLGLGALLIPYVAGDRTEER